MRQDFRSYLSDSYKLIEDKNKITKTFPKKVIKPCVNRGAIGTFFNISSTYDGTDSLFSSHITKRNPQTISAESKATLTELAQLSENTATKSKIQQALSRP